jgi:hypothetical protein
MCERRRGGASDGAAARARVNPTRFRRNLRRARS